MMYLGAHPRGKALGRVGVEARLVVATEGRAKAGSAPEPSARVSLVVYDSGRRSKRRARFLSHWSPSKLHLQKMLFHALGWYVLWRVPASPGLPRIISGRPCACPALDGVDACHVGQRCAHSGIQEQGRILENLGAVEVELSADELAQLEATLDGITVYGIAVLRGKAGQSYREMQRLVLRGGICHPKVFFDH